MRVTEPFGQDHTAYVVFVNSLHDDDDSAVVHVIKSVRHRFTKPTGGAVSNYLRFTICHVVPVITHNNVATFTCADAPDRRG